MRGVACVWDEEGRCEWDRVDCNREEVEERGKRRGRNAKRKEAGKKEGSRKR